MEELLNLTEKTEVDCIDGVCGHLSRALVDTSKRTVAHLVVERNNGMDVRLVPFDRVRTAGDQIVLACSSDDLDSFASGEELLRVPSPLAAAGGNLQERTIRRHAIPEGEAEIYIDEDVRAKNGRIGHLRGLLINAGNGNIEELIVTVGRIFAKHDVSVPASFINEFKMAEVQLNTSKNRVMDRVKEVA